MAEQEHEQETDLTDQEAEAAETALMEREREDALARVPRFTDPELRRLAELAQVMVWSGFFKDTKQASQAMVKVMYGRELGFTPLASMGGIHVIEGKVELGAHLVASLVGRHPEYDYRVKEHTAERCVIEFFKRRGPAHPGGGQKWESIGVSEFTLKDAQSAGLVKEKGGWKKWPKAMLFARAMTQGQRWYCPEVTAGIPVFAEGELVEDEPAEGTLRRTGSICGARYLPGPGAPVEVCGFIADHDGPHEWQRVEPAEAEALLAGELGAVPEGVDPETGEILAAAGTVPVCVVPGCGAEASMVVGSASYCRWHGEDQERAERDAEREAEGVRGVTDQQLGAISQLLSRLSPMPEELDALLVEHGGEGTMRLGDLTEPQAAGLIMHIQRRLKKREEEDSHGGSGDEPAASAGEPSGVPAETT